MAARRSAAAHPKEAGRTSWRKTPSTSVRSVTAARLLSGICSARCCSGPGRGSHFCAVGAAAFFGSRRPGSQSRLLLSAFRPRHAWIGADFGDFGDFGAASAQPYGRGWLGPGTGRSCSAGAAVPHACCGDGPRTSGPTCGRSLFTRRAGLRSFDDPILDVGCGRRATNLASLQAFGFRRLLGIDPCGRRQRVRRRPAPKTVDPRGHGVLSGHHLPPLL